MVNMDFGFGFILLVRLVFIHSSINDTDANCGPKRKELNVEFADKALEGPVLSSFVSAGEIDCQYHCHSNDDCELYNFYEKRNLCELLDGRSTAFSVRSRKSWIFKAQKCDANPCLNGGSCFMNIKTKCVCPSCYSGDICQLEDSVFGLGMESGVIPNAFVIASSFYASGHEAWRARLHNQPIIPNNPFVNSGSWSAKINRAGEYLQVDLGREKRVAMVATQGRPRYYNQWVVSYTLAYSAGGTRFEIYQDHGNEKVFPGNSDRDTIVTHDLKPPIRARYIRFVVKSWHSHISMRAELYGCP